MWTRSVCDVGKSLVWIHKEIFWCFFFLLLLLLLLPPSSRTRKICITTKPRAHTCAVQRLFALCDCACLPVWCVYAVSVYAMHMYNFCVFTITQRSVSPYTVSCTSSISGTDFQILFIISRTKNRIGIVYSGFSHQLWIQWLAHRFHVWETEHYYSVHLFICNIHRGIHEILLYV